MIESPQYDTAAETAAHICNVLDGDQPKAVKFGKILFLILDVIYWARDHYTKPSDN